MKAQADAVCGPDGSYAPVNDAIACYHYLDNLGSQACRVPSGQRESILCSAGVAEVTGLGIGQSSSW